VKYTCWILLVIALLALSGAARASEGAPAQGYDLSWWTVDGGGGSWGGGDYRLTGAVGQPDAGPPLATAEYTLQGGFWSGAVPPAVHILNLPLILRSH
jgi:hypothetical protein